jgi:preprotein translocase SecE subunit
VQPLPAGAGNPPGPPRPPAPPITGGPPSWDDDAWRQGHVVSRPAVATRAFDYLSEVRGELRKVAWPTRSEVIYNSALVLLCVVLIVAAIAGLDGAVGRAASAIFYTVGSWSAINPAFVGAKPQAPK